MSSSGRRLREERFLDDIAATETLFLEKKFGGVARFDSFENRSRVTQDLLYFTAPTAGLYNTVLLGRFRFLKRLRSSKPEKNSAKKMTG